MEATQVRCILFNQFLGFSGLDLVRDCRMKRWGDPFVFQSEDFTSFPSKELSADKEWCMFMKCYIYPCPSNSRISSGIPRG